MAIIQLPVIHLNGTSGERLLAGYERTRELLMETTRAFEDIEFNARDYYPAGDDAFQAARAQREEMNKHLVYLKRYLDAHYLHIQDEVEARAR